jgi:hypothetical protein
MSPALRARRVQRFFHLVLATALGTYFYSPLSDLPAATLAMQAVVFPTLALSGVLMWKGPQLWARFGR